MKHIFTIGDKVRLRDPESSYRYGIGEIINRFCSSMDKDGEAVISYRVMFDKESCCFDVDENEIEKVEDSGSDILIDTVVGIEGILLKTDLQWTISYNPSTKSYSVWMSKEEEEKEDD